MRTVMLSIMFLMACAFGSLNTAFAQTAIYRSLGNTVAALATGGANPLNIAAGVATFTSAVPTNVGIGDVIQFDSDHNGTIDSYAIIQSRLSSQVFGVKIADGLTNPTAEIGDTHWSIFRAYTSINNLDQGSENPSLDPAIADFDTWTTGRDMVVNNEIWHIACYGDATLTTSQAVGNYGGWNTDATHYLHLYTPFSTSEVGITQRHSGVWDPTKFNINVNTTLGGTDDQTFSINGIFNIWVEGFQIFRNENTLAGDVVYFANLNSTPGVVLNFNNNIIRGLTGGGVTIHGLSVRTNENASMTIWNNIIYNITSRGITEDSFKGGGIAGVTFLLNNTVVNADIGMWVRGVAGNGRNVVARNNLVQGAVTWGFDGSGAAPAFGGSFSGASSYNISNHVTDTPFGVGFVTSSAVVFVNAAGSDYRLSPTDAVAKDAGTSQSGYFTDDIEGYTRGDGSWDIGADEADPVPKAPTVVSVF